jgi:hypothetical protein
LRRALALQAEIDHLRSLVHRDAGEFDRDRRPGAVLVDVEGRVQAEHVEMPGELAGAWNPGGTSVSPWPALSGGLPPGHPRALEDRSRSSSALIRDAFDDPWERRR